MGNDISNLLSKFGATVDGYLEIEAAIDYKEPARKVKAPLVVAKAEPAMAPVENESAAADPAPVVAASAVVPMLAGSPVSPSQRIEPVIEPVVEPALAAANVAVPVPAPAAVAPVPPAAKLTPSPSSRIAVAPAQASPAIPAIPADAADTAVATDTPVPSLLRSMLGEAARARQAQQGASNDGPGDQQDAQPPSTPAQVIAVVSPKGGVGKTTLCSALACSLARHGRVFAIDLDPQNALQYHLGVDTQAAAAMTPAGAAASWRDGVAQGMAGTQVVSHALVADNGEVALAQQMAHDGQWLLRQLQAMQLQSGDVVLLDLPAGQTPYLDQALQAADQVLAVVTPDAGSFLALEHMRQVLHGRNNCRYVVNKYDGTRSFNQDMLEVLKRWMGPRLAGVIALDHAISEGLAYGYNPLVKGGDSPAYEQLQRVSEALRAALAKAHAAGGRA
ncbi:cellulose biosynthesis protein BcsQ [Herbaspirillum aquaticum]|uniref:Cellulose synthase operon protein YhjQ n=1 Tax=Herbaspirillum aquaticum TaxID=568783 RepID=A0A225SMT4_9BURK|nr:cellulose biosynthesis protein BcsQ [Herbaspirillum aquaticum]OWY32391.1 cellulose synthase operon protein YhjQ [Herbaspirillum aquaticum]